MESRPRRQRLLQGGLQTGLRQGELQRIEGDLAGAGAARLAASARALLLAEGEPIDGEELSPIHGDDVAIGEREADIIIERRTGGRRDRRVTGAQRPWNAWGSDIVGLFRTKFQVDLRCA